MQEKQIRLDIKELVLINVINKYEANICYEGKKHRLGYFNTAEEAAKAYDAKAKEIDSVHFTINFN